MLSDCFGYRRGNLGHHEWLDDQEVTYTTKLCEHVHRMLTSWGLLLVHRWTTWKKRNIILGASRTETLSQKSISFPKSALSPEKTTEKCRAALSWLADGGATW